jgi:hypothetical protein
MTSELTEERIAEAVAVFGNLSLGASNDEAAA